MADGTCKEDGCETFGRIRWGWCVMHYRRWQEHGDALYRPPSAAERFWAKVNKDGPTVYDHLGPCWVWTAGITRAGYGLFCLDRDHRKINAHRAIWMLTFGTIPPGIHVCHRCDNRLCVRPAHLFLGTRSDNMTDCVDKERHPMAAKTHCPAGHPYSGDNLYLNPKGRRECRACRARRAEERRANGG